MCLKLMCCAAIMFIAYSSFAQDSSPFKSKKIDAEDFHRKIYGIDSNAAAIILADVGSTSFEGNRKGWFTLIFKRRTRIHILRQSAMDLASLKISLYKNAEDKESLEDIKASTFNEYNGEITETKLSEKDIFEEKLDKNHTVRRFTMPAVKEGSVIDIAYTIKSDFAFNLQPWTFQYLSYPCLWSEYEVSVPALLNYVFLKQGYHKFYIEKKSEKHEAYSVTVPAENGILGMPDRQLFVSTIATKYRWVMKDLPKFENVDHLTTPSNYLDKIEFQLSQISNDGQTVKDVMNTWPKVTEQLMKDEEFAGALANDNSWLDKDLQNIPGGAGDQLVVSKSIYEFVKRNYTCTGDGYRIRTKLQDVFKSRKGNAGEINLILIAMLRKMGISADPVLVSTRSNGRPHEGYPMVSKYNYAFCRILINNSSWFLDAGHPLLGFGRLDPECYNGKARVINFDAQNFDLSADSLKERKYTAVVVVHGDNGSIRASIKKIPGYYESYHLREEIAKNGKSNFLNELKSSVPFESEIENSGIDSLEMLDQPLGIHCEFAIKPETADIMYLNPMFGQGYEKNFFKAEERVLPVEMDFAADNTYQLTMEVPKGYIVAEVPKSVKVKLNAQDDGFFEYLVQHDANYVMLRTRLVIKRTWFDPDEYPSLREFFNLIIKKQTENIVFRKAH